MTPRPIFAGCLGLAALALPARALGEEAQVATGATIAVGPTAEPQVAEDDTPWMLLAIKIEGGLAVVPHEATGAYVRLGAEGMLSNDPDRAGLIWGFWDAFEGWGASEAGGFALPVVFYAGYRAAPFVTTLGGGVNLFTIDNLHDDAGAGIFSPRAELRMGAQAGHLLFLATSDLQYRWLWGRDDITLFQVGVSLGWANIEQRPSGRGHDPGFVQVRQPPAKK